MARTVPGLASLSCLMLALGCGVAPAGPRTPLTVGSPNTHAGATSTTASARPVDNTYPAYAVTAQVPMVLVRASPAGAVLARLRNPRASGAPLTFLLDHRQGGWLKVFLPVRPNGSEGWINSADSTLRGVPYRLDVHIDAHRLDLFGYGRLLRTFPVGVGKTATPTPGGTFYLVELLRPPSPYGPYGPYAYGLSGHSTTLQSFSGSDAVIGLHGTDTPSSVGHDVSHGCLRLLNADITYLAGLLPLGTPVRILH